MKKILLLAGCSALALTGGVAFAMNGEPDDPGHDYRKAICKLYPWMPGCPDRDDDAPPPGQGG